MLITVDELKTYIDTEELEPVLTARLAALEHLIRKYTNNNFQKRGFRRSADIIGGTFVVEALTPFEAGDTVQVSYSELNNGIYTVTEVTGSTFQVEERIYDEKDVIVTKVEYPDDVKLGAVNILKWQLKNEAENSGDASKKGIRSETLSRYSVTYADDATESDLDAFFGVPKKYMSFLRLCRKARF